MKRICFAVGLITFGACAATSAIAADYIVRVDTGGVCCVTGAVKPCAGRDVKTFSSRKDACVAAKTEEKCLDYIKGMVEDCQKDGVTLKAK
jgi:hypothetical protein